MAEKQWFPVYTHPRAEKVVYSLLQQKDIESYLPLRKTLKQWSDRKKWVEEPLLRSYLFVRINRIQMAEVLMTRGIARFLYFSGEVATVPDRQMEELQYWVKSGLPLQIDETPLEKGQMVEVLAGPLKGVKAELLEIRQEKKLILRLDSIGYAMLVQVSKGYVRGI